MQHDQSNEPRIGIPEVVYTSTRNKTGKFEPSASGESVALSDVNLKTLKGHLDRHLDGSVGGSQFNPKLFKDDDAVIAFLEKHLPDTIPLDVHDRAEITLRFNIPIGTSAIEKVELLDTASIQVEPRIPGGELGEHDGQAGAWYPEVEFKDGQFEVVLDGDGKILNPHGKFEPNANIALATSLPETNELTVIIEKDSTSGEVEVRAAFPGKNAPAFPTNINATQSGFKRDTTDPDSLESKFWKEHAFVRVKEQ